VDTFRRQVVSIAQSLVDAGRLDNTEQVFDLGIGDIERAMEDPSINLRELAEKNTRFLRKIKDIHDFPPVIDSRGKIFFPTRREFNEGELVGEPISPGTVRGPVKVLHTPDEKPVLPGDILVAEATDPGWTPLFINAGGVVLEIGGLLHHGALVAREYGKPCVAGIEDVTSLLQDGQEVEVDGLNGIVRVITDT
jgi:pyruvate,water dikinase